MPETIPLAGALHQSIAWRKDEDVNPNRTANDRDNRPSREDTKNKDYRDRKNPRTSIEEGANVFGPWKRPPTSDQRPRRSTVAEGLTQWIRSPIQAPTVKDTSHYIKKIASKRPPGLSITTGHGRRRGATVPDRFHARNPDEIFSDSSPSPGSPVQGFWGTQSDSEDEHWAHRFSRGPSQSPDSPRRDHWDTHERGEYRRWHSEEGFNSESSAVESPQMPRSRSSDFSSSRDSDQGFFANGVPRPMSLYPDRTVSELDLSRELHGYVDRVSLPRDFRPYSHPWEQANSRQQTATTTNRVQLPKSFHATPNSSEPKISRRLSDTAANQSTPRSHDSPPTVAKLGFSKQPSGTEGDVGTPRDPEALRTGSELAGSKLIDDLAGGNVSPPRSSEPDISRKLPGGISVDDPSGSPTSSSTAALGTPNNVVGHSFTGSFAAARGSPPPTSEATRQLDVQASERIPVSSSSRSSPRSSISATDRGNHTGTAVSIQEEQKARQSSKHSPAHYVDRTDSGSDTGTVIRDPAGEQEGQEASHNKTKVALLEALKRKHEVEQKLRRVQIEYKQILQDHAAGQETLGKNYQDLVAVGEEQESAHNRTRIALLKSRKEKHETEQKLDRAAIQYRQQLQAVGILAEDNVQPIWEIDSDGRQTRPLYKDFPNMARESHVNLLLNRANCKFMLAEYQEMATIAFEALAVAERLNFKPLFGRCNFVIGIAFYHDCRFDEAQHRFWLALDCKGKYGISTECVERWLEKCNDSIVGNPSTDARSPIRDKYSQDTDRVADTSFRADTFFAKATNVACHPESTDVESDEGVEDLQGLEGYTVCPSQGYDDESDEIEEIPDPRADGPKEPLFEEEQSTLTIGPRNSPSLPFKEMFPVEDTVGEPSHVAIPHIGAYDTPIAPFVQFAPSAIEEQKARTASRSWSSLSIDPMPVESSYAPFNYVEEKPTKVRGRAVTTGEQKAGKGPRHGKLTGPLSWLTKDVGNIPVMDMEAWVNRSLAKRREEATKEHWQNRPPVAFILYRSAYTDSIRSMFKGASHQLVSSLASESWKMELPKVREQYGAWAILERENQEKAFPEDNAI